MIPKSPCYESLMSSIKKGTPEDYDLFISIVPNHLIPVGLFAPQKFRPGVYGFSSPLNNTEDFSLVKIDKEESIANLKIGDSRSLMIGDILRLDTGEKVLIVATILGWMSYVPPDLWKTGLHGVVFLRGYDNTPKIRCSGGVKKIATLIEHRSQDGLSVSISGKPNQVNKLQDGIAPE